MSTRIPDTPTMALGNLPLSAPPSVARRSVFQLLYDDVSAWLNPQDNCPAQG